MLIREHLKNTESITERNEGEENPQIVYNLIYKR